MGLSHPLPLVLLSLLSGTFSLWLSKLIGSLVSLGCSHPFKCESSLSKSSQGKWVEAAPGWWGHGTTAPALKIYLYFSVVKRFCMGKMKLQWQLWSLIFFWHSASIGRHWPCQSPALNSFTLHSTSHLAWEPWGKTCREEISPVFSGRFYSHATCASTLSSNPASATSQLWEQLLNECPCVAVPLSAN